jgi:protein-disulfide isomerase
LWARRIEALLLVALFAFVVLVSRRSVATALRDDPRLLAMAIDRHPEAFISALQRADAHVRAALEQQQRMADTERRNNERRAPLEPRIDTGRVVLGALSAPVTIVEYSDFQCVYCRAGRIAVEKVVARYPGRVRVFFKHMPAVGSHPFATVAATYFEAVSLQGGERALRFRDMVFEKQDDLSSRGESLLRELAVLAGSDTARVRRDLVSAQVRTRLASDSAEVDRFRLSGTPSYVINGVTYRGLFQEDDLVALVSSLVNR